jgi:hypothetical protein
VDSFLLSFSAKSLVQNILRSNICNKVNLWKWRNTIQRISKANYLIFGRSLKRNTQLLRRWFGSSHGARKPAVGSQQFFNILRQVDVLSLKDGINSITSLQLSPLWSSIEFFLHLENTLITSEAATYPIQWISRELLRYNRFYRSLKTRAACCGSNKTHPLLWGNSVPHPTRMYDRYCSSRTELPWKSTSTVGHVTHVVRRSCSELVIGMNSVRI